MRSTARFNDICIPDNDFYRIYRNPQKVGCDLRKAGLLTLTSRLSTYHDLNDPICFHSNIGTLSWGTNGGLNIICKPTTQPFSPCTSLHFPFRKSRPVNKIQRDVHIPFILTAVISHTKRILVRHRIRRDEILPTQFDWIESELVRRCVYYSF